MTTSTDTTSRFRMLLALAMNRRARGLRGLDVLRRSQDRAPPQRT